MRPDGGSTGEDELGREEWNESLRFCLEILPGAQGSGQLVFSCVISPRTLKFPSLPVMGTEALGLEEGQQVGTW